LVGSDGNAIVFGTTPAGLVNNIKIGKQEYVVQNESLCL
jgi:hypothetical protein